MALLIQQHKLPQMYGPPRDCKGKFGRGDKSAQMYTAFGWRVSWLVMREIVLLVAIGIAVGIPVTLAGSHVVANLLFGLRGTHIASLLGSAVARMLVSIMD